MICYVCGHNGFVKVQQHTAPDVYEKYAGIDDVQREWLMCSRCSFFMQSHNYASRRLDKVYVNGYRDWSFRGITIKDMFWKIINLPESESENLHRVRWLTSVQDLSGKTLLDIGTGFGVFPFELLRHTKGLRVLTTDPNEQSYAFLNDELKIDCIRCFGIPIVDNKFDFVSFVHVLEHLEDPEWSLQDAKNVLMPGGKVFIEVPDAIEFNELDKDHDEFNSCHLWFFTVPTLTLTVESAGYTVTDIHRVKHQSRGLSRILMVARSDDRK